MKKQNKYINLLDIQRAYIQEQNRIAQNVKGGVLVVEIPRSCAGFCKTDKHYITPEAFEVNARIVLQGCFN